MIEIIQHADERRTGKSLNEYQFSITSSDESAQRATSDGKLIRVQGFSCPEVMSACCITIPATTEQRRHHDESIQFGHNILSVIYFCGKLQVDCTQIG